MSNTYSENNKRIAKNTLMLYGRMLFTMLVSLYTTRVILEVLGVDDYGLLGLVGAIIGMMDVVTSLLSGGTTRFITLALGRGNMVELKNTFSASMAIHLALALIILALGEIFGPSMVNNLNIAPERLGAAHFVFQLSLLSAVIGISQSPFHAAIMAHEKMSVYAYISIWDVVAKLLIVYLLLVVNVDKLKLYSIFFFIVSLITTTVYYIYCRTNFEECHKFKYKADWKLYKEIAGYSGWNAISAIAFTMNGQGITILLNIFGTVVIAARSIAGSISGFVYGFVANFQSAVRPQIIKLFSVNDFQGMNQLIIRTSKFSLYLMAIIGVPLFIEMDYVLRLWLKDVPDYTVVFARLTLIQGLVQAVDFPVGAGLHAVGKMKLPNITSAFIYMAILPVSYFTIKLGASPSIVYVVIVSVYPLAYFMDLYIMKKYTQFPVYNCLCKIILPSLAYIIVTYLVTSFAVVGILPPSFLRVVLTTLVSSAIYLPLVYCLGLTHGERLLVSRVIKKKLNFRKID